jgi:hypothetical protein
MFLPTYRPTERINRVPPPAVLAVVNRMRDVEELENAARLESDYSTFKLVAIAQRAALCRKPEQLNGPGEHKNSTECRR